MNDDGSTVGQSLRSRAGRPEKVGPVSTCQAVSQWPLICEFEHPRPRSYMP